MKLFLGWEREEESGPGGDNIHSSWRELTFPTLLAEACVAKQSALPN